MEVAHSKDVVVVTIHLKKQDFIFGLSLLSVILLTGKSSSEFKLATYVDITHIAFKSRYIQNTEVGKQYRSILMVKTLVTLLVTDARCILYFSCYMFTAGFYDCNHIVLLLQTDRKIQNR